MDGVVQTILRYQVVACEGKGTGTGEQSLLRDLLEHHIASGDVVLADALLATWWIIEGMLARGGDGVMAQHGRRITDFTRGERWAGSITWSTGRVRPGQSR